MSWPTCSTALSPVSTGLAWRTSTRLPVRLRFVPEVALRHRASALRRHAFALACSMVQRRSQQRGGGALFSCRRNKRRGHRRGHWPCRVSVTLPSRATGSLARFRSASMKSTAILHVRSAHFPLLPHEPAVLMAEHRSALVRCRSFDSYTARRADEYGGPEAILPNISVPTELSPAGWTRWVQLPHPRQGETHRLSPNVRVTPLVAVADLGLQLVDLLLSRISLLPRLHPAPLERARVVHRYNGRPQLAGMAQRPVCRHGQPALCRPVSWPSPLRD